jgi:hypothetical protein
MPGIAAAQQEAPAFHVRDAAIARQQPSENSKK